VRGGATKICFVIAPGKSDILQYFGGEIEGTPVCYAVQPQAEGLCDAVFRAAPLVSPGEGVVLGLPDTVWFPGDALARLPADRFALLLFPVEQPALFGAVVTREDGSVREIHVKRPGTPSSWIWGAMKMPGEVFHALHAPSPSPAEDGQPRASQVVRSSHDSAPRLSRSPQLSRASAETRATRERARPARRAGARAP
jgi:dTDP-glucose pyrophosphorylase